MIRRAMILALVGGVATLTAQAPAALPPAPAFEVASVKRNVSGAAGALGSSFYRIPDVGQVSIVNVPLRDIVARAYGIDATRQRFMLAGGPADILDARVDITANPPDDAAPGRALDMLRTLLVTRFNLRIRPETRHVPIYVLTMARSDGTLGPDLRPSSHDCEALYAAGRQASDADPPRDPKGRGLCWNNHDFAPFGRGTIGARFAGPVSALVSRGIQPFADRPVVDRTRLAGNYEWNLTVSLDPLRAGDVPTLDVAVVEQLGLKLERQTGPFDVLVIDSVEMPAPD
jgi:uncharacterized protein (TIGR03435 family)